MLPDEDPRHETGAPLLPAAFLIPLLLALFAWSLVMPAQAAERRGRLTIELQLATASARSPKSLGGWPNARATLSWKFEEL